MRRRWVLLIFLPLYAMLLMLVGTLIVRALVSESWEALQPGAVLEDVAGATEEPIWWGWMGILALVFVSIQAAFVLPLCAARPPRDQRSKSLKLSLIVGGMVVAVLTFALTTALAEFFNWTPIDEQTHDPNAAYLILLGFFLVSWILWSYILLVFTRGIWADRILRRTVGLLLGGTIAELLIVVPLDVMVRRRTDCYCFSGTYFSLCLSAFVLVFLAGPGVVLVLTAKKHRLWRQSHCERCGYERGPTPAARCPECGTAWKAVNAA